MICSGQVPRMDHCKGRGLVHSVAYPAMLTWIPSTWSTLITSQQTPNCVIQLSISSLRSIAVCCPQLSIADCTEPAELGLHLPNATTTRTHSSCARERRFPEDEDSQSPISSRLLSFQQCERDDAAYQSRNLNTKSAASHS